MSTTKQQVVEGTHSHPYEDPVLQELAKQGDRDHVLWELKARGSMGDLSFEDNIRELSIQDRSLSYQVREYIRALDTWNNETNGLSDNDYADAKWGDLADQIIDFTKGYTSKYASSMDWQVSVETVAPGSISGLPNNVYRWQARELASRPIGVTVYTRSNRYYVVTHRNGIHQLKRETGDFSVAAKAAALERAVFSGEQRVPQERADLIEHLDSKPRHALLGALDDTADDLAFQFRVPRSMLYDRLRAIYDSYPVN